MTNNKQNGVLSTLTFEILKDATGAADIDLILNQGSTFNIDFEDVEFAVSGGKVNIGKSATTTTTKSITTTKKDTSKPITTTTVINPTTDPMLSIADVTGEAGDTVEVEVEISNNPGIIALSFDVEYDASKLKLVNAEDEKILGTSTSVFGNDLSANPYRLCWDDPQTKTMSRMVY